MTTEDAHDRGLTRRAFAGLGIAAGAAAVAGFPEVPAIAGSTSVTRSDVPDAYGSINAVLTYMQIDALAFDTYEYGQARYFVDSSGVQSVNSGHWVAAPIPIPCGSTIYQVNIGYRYPSPIEIRLRDLNANTYAAPFQRSLPASSATSAQVSYDVSPSVTVDTRKSALFAFYSSGGSALYGVTIGYLPPTQGFVPFSGAAPRVLDTRNSGGPLQPDEERVIDLGFAGPRGAVLNLTVANTGDAGYVAVFPANITWPNNSSINWSSANQIIANGVTTALDANGRIRIRGGASQTHVIIDRIGWLI